MHMADALVSPAVAGTMYACSAAVTAYSIKKVNDENDQKKIPVMGVMGAFVFATQMVNFTIPGTGSSGHFCGGLLLSAILGPYAGFLTMVGVLLIQCLLFADGGLLALGCNIWNMSFYGCFLGALIIWKLFMKQGMSKTKIVAASIAGCVLSLQLGAFSVVVETLASNVTELPFSTFVSVMQPIHLAIGVGEGIITAAVLVFIYEVRPELLYCSKNATAKHTFSMKKVLCVLTMATVLVAGGVSLLASSNPDGLEWSIEKITGQTELEKDGGAYAKAEKTQEITSLLPDYAFRESDSVGGTIVSGILGSLVVFLVCFGGQKIFVKLRRK